nr:retrovirus-related Pol polyprotein from transposon TNT 1-94 [Tanacetum cinerariifolium]GFB09132.1 retrovirus-related Pol polyprotein from transposon TNT 1-94 [Tanacetum cinerariifolium]
MLTPDSDEVIRLEKESRSKLSDLIRPFDCDKLNNLYDLFVPQRKKSFKQRYFSERSRLSHINVNNGTSKEFFNKQTTLLEKRMDESIPLDKQCQSSLEIFKVNTIITGVELCKQKIAKRAYIGYIDPFIQSTIESNFCPIISRISDGLNQFLGCLNDEMVADLRYLNSLESEVDSLRSQLKTQKIQFLNEIDRLSREYYYDLKAQLQDKGIVISELKKLIEKIKRKSVDTKFEKASVIRQPNAFKSQRPSVLGKLTTFSNSFHDMCVLKSVAKPLKETVASDSSKKPRNFTRKLYERVSKTCSWWYPKFTPSGYKWKPKSGKENVNPNLVKIVLFIVDSGCSKHMTGNLKLLINFVEKFLGTVKFRNDQIAPILGYGDLVQGAVTIKRVYYVEGLSHNLFSVGQFCYADLEVAFWKSTCFIRDLKGNDLLTGDIVSSMVMASSSVSFELRHHQRAVKELIVVGLPKLKFVKDHLCSSCELGKAKQKSFHTKLTPSSKRRLQLLHMNLCGHMRVASINGKR